MSTEDRVGYLRQAHLGLHEEFFDRVLSYCESPIEKLFMAAGICHGWRPLSWREHHEIWTHVKKIPGAVPARFLGFPDGRHLAIQLTVGARRIDFAIFDLTFSIALAIEIDGHDFHERTKEQARRDRSRDRALTGDGWTPLRFTGSEVYADAAACWEEVDAISSRLIEEREGR